jgi:orotidine-5'-phosphate decarboxylase
VSILTSINEKESKEIYNQEIPKTVSSMFNLANETNIDGIVCSPHELKLAGNLLQDKIKITPGIRLSDSNSDDQSRVMTPKEAIDLGATYLVIGRPITSHKDKASAFEKIYQSIYEK